MNGNNKKQVPVWAIAGFVIQFIIVLITAVVFIVRVDSRASNNTEDIKEFKAEYDAHVESAEVIKEKLNKLEADSEWIKQALTDIKEDL